MLSQFCRGGHTRSADTTRGAVHGLVRLSLRFICTGCKSPLGATSLRPRGRLPEGTWFCRGTDILLLLRRHDRSGLERLQRPAPRRGLRVLSRINRASLSLSQRLLARLPHAWPPAPAQPHTHAVSPLRSAVRDRIGSSTHKAHTSWDSQATDALPRGEDNASR